MGLKAYRPTTSGRRGMTAVTTEELTKKRPEKSLTSFELRTGARNNQGRTTVRFGGAGHKRLYR
ncbi:MAG TPA: 50S ribosomal protein L2, partial [Nitrospiraceae bacterium]